MSPLPPPAAPSSGTPEEGGSRTIAVTKSAELALVGFAGGYLAALSVVAMMHRGAPDPMSVLFVWGPVSGAAHMPLVARALRSKHVPVWMSLVAVVAVTGLAALLAFALELAHAPRWYRHNSWLLLVPTASWAIVTLTIALLAQDLDADPDPEVLPDRCPACDYDLTGNRSGACPECGRSRSEPTRATLQSRWRSFAVVEDGMSWAASIVRWAVGCAGVATCLMLTFCTIEVISSWGDDDDCGSCSANFHSILQTVRSQIELYDVQNPLEPFDPAKGWSQLVEGGYILDQPRNPSTGRVALSVGREPDTAAGWAWAPDAAGADITVRPRDEDGRVTDADSYGSPY